MAETKILVASDGDTARIKVEGRATYRCCPDLKVFAQSFLDQSKYHFLINLESCEGMDSSFMGVLAMIGIPCKQNKSEVIIVNVSPENKKLLDDLGVSKLFIFDSDDSSGIWQTLDIPDKPDVDKAMGQVMLEAHETLNKVDPSNVPKFKDVIDYLREDLEIDKDVQ